MNKQDFRDLGITYLSIGEFMNKYGEHIDATVQFKNKPDVYVVIRIEKLSNLKEEILKKIESLKKEN
jgi:hypothetical protein